jgi:hypothetical protein
MRAHYFSDRPTGVLVQASSIRRFHAEKPHA